MFLYAFVKLSTDQVVSKPGMLKKLLTLNLVFVLILQPVTVVFAGSSDGNLQVAGGYFSDIVMDCEHMDTMDCPGKDVCSTMGHAGCDVKSLRILSVVEPGSLDVGESLQLHKNGYLPLTANAPPLRPPRVS